MARVPYPRITFRLPAELRRPGEQIDRNFAELEKLPATGAIPVIDLGEGAVVTGYSRQFWFPEATSFSGITALLTVAGSTDTVVEILVDGATKDTMTIPSGTTEHTHSLTLAIPAGGIWQMRVTSAGTGASGLAFFGEAS